MQYKYDEYFKLRLFIKAKLIEEKNMSINASNTIQRDYNFTTDNIISNLKDLLNIDKELFSNLFEVDSINEKTYSVKCLENNELYLMSKINNIPENYLNPKDIIYISNYYVENDKNNISDKTIQFNELTLIEKMNEENLFILLENNEEISDKYFWGKIVEKDEENKTIKIMNNNKKLLQLQEYNDKICLGQYCVFSNYYIKNNIIKLDHNSFTYFSSQDLYFSTKLKLNNFSVIRFYFLDFNKNGNIFNMIKIQGNSDENKIENDVMECIINLKMVNANYKLFPIQLELKENSFKEGIKFYTQISLGLLTKINLLINYKSENSYSYEYLYMFFNKTNIYNKNKIININDKKIEINIFDDFDSENRIRFNIVNIPFQNEINKESLNINKKEDIGKLNNSLLVCETFKNDFERNIYGVFKLYEIFDNIPLPLNKNSSLNKYYNLFGNVYDFVKTNKEDDEAEKFIKEWCNKEIGTDVLNLGDYPNYEDEITSSQLKTKMGILIIKYLKKKQMIKEKLIDFKHIHIFITIIERNKNQFSNNQILRIFSYFMRRTIGEGVMTNLLVLSDLTKDSHSPYYLATQFNLKEIESMNEYSKLFQGYLQMDSHIVYNYHKKAYSYSLSIEPLFIVKYHLKSIYEGFLFYENINNDRLAWTEKDLNVIVINNLNLFENSKYSEIIYI